MKRNEIEDRKRSLEFYANYIEISKISLLYKLNVEINNLNTIRSLKRNNHNLLNKIGVKWLNKYNNFYEIKSADLPKLYILVDPVKFDDYAKVAFAKMRQVMRTIAKNDYVITVGPRVARVASRFDLQVIENMPFNDFEEVSYFAEKISSLIEVGLSNNVFGEVHLIFAENDLNTKGLVRYNLFPFDKSQLEKRAESYDIDGAPIFKNENEVQWVSDYRAIFDAIDLKKTKWYPNVATFYNLFAKAIIKGQIFEGKQERRIQALTLEVAILDEKKKKVEEQMIDVKRLWNRIRKDDATIASLILFAAFKTKKKQLASNPQDYASFAKKVLTTSERGL